VDFTLECSGNHGAAPFATGLLDNARWAGTPLAPVLRKAGLRREAVGVVVYRIDRGPITVRDNTGIVTGGVSGTVEPDSNSSICR
jgi:DMSO/TMAO reductase YedYZ molybdopterin-dependent catalytic subunit